MSVRLSGSDPPLTLLPPQQSFNTLDQFVSVAVSIDPDFLQFFMTHISQDVQGDL